MRLFRPLQSAIDTVVAELKRIGDSLQKQAETKGKTETTEDKPEPVTPVINAVLNVPQSMVSKHEADTTQTNIREDKKLFWERLTFVAIVLYTTVAALQWCANNKAANAAKTSADTAATQLELSERPWVTVSITLEEPPHSHSPSPSLTFNADGTASLNAFIVVKNIGHSIARNVSIRPQMYPPIFERILTEPTEKQKAWCDKVRTEVPIERFLPSLFPEKKTPKISPCQ